MQLYLLSPYGGIDRGCGSTLLSGYDNVLFIADGGNSLGVEILSLFEIKNLTYYYPDNNLPALRNIDFALEEGEFVLVVGGSGSGKSSLARVLAGLIPDFYGGCLSGKLYYKGQEVGKNERRGLCADIGMVFQDPEKQLVMTSVEAEIAFGLENLGLPQQEMFRRIAEVMSFLDLSQLRQEFTVNLSGGQKQKVALASVLAMQPRILILDEPTSQLDPISAEELLDLIERLNKELGYSVILIEQRLERCFHLADRLLVMDKGEIICAETVPEAARWQVAHNQPFLPPVARFFALLDAAAIPLTVKEGRRELKKMLPSASIDFKPRTFERKLRHSAGKKRKTQLPALIELKDIWFTYPKGREALRGIDLGINRGDFAVIMGRNASGKTTLLKLCAGLLKPDRGRLCIAGEDTRKFVLSDLARHIGYLSQNPNDYLFQDTVEDELRFTLQNFEIKDIGKIDLTLNRLGLDKVRTTNPRDLSSGERQRVALAAVLVTEPEILLLDEPTRGIDIAVKKELGLFLQDLNRQGVTVVMVTHDVEFAAEYANRIVLMFDGKIAADGTKLEIMPNSLFYSPQMARLFKGLDDSVLTVKDALARINAGGETVETTNPS